MSGRRRALPTIAWEAESAWRELLGPDAATALPLDAWLRDGRAAIVKRGAGRTVYRVDFAERSFFLKHLRHGGLRQAIKQWFRPGACRREFEKARELARRGVPAVAPLALGERRRGGRLHDSYLVTAAVPNARSLDEVLEECPAVNQASRSGTRRPALLSATARLCAVAHAAGVFHDDLHGGNILVRNDEADPAVAPQLFLVDLPGVELSQSLDRRRTRDSLAMLCAGFLRRTSSAERRRFVREYVAARRDLQIADERAFATEIYAAAIVHARRVAERRDKRVWADNRDFYRLRTSAGEAHAVRELSPALVEQWLERPAALWQAHVDRPVKLSVGSLVVEAELVGETRTIPAAVKRLRPKTWWKAVADRFRRGRAREAWHRGHALLARGIPTARPLAVYESHRSSRSESYLVTEWLEGACDLHLYGWELVGRTAEARRRRIRQVAAAAGKVVGRLHDAGFTHRDLKGNNLLARESADDVELFLIDLDGLRHGGRPTRAACCKNLTRLALSAEMHPWVSRSDRLRFLRAYMKQQSTPSDGGWKSWWRETAKHVVAELAKLRAGGKAVT